MKILTKNQITEVKNKERQLDIEQGMGFARKVDALRETKEKEEIALAKFRKDSTEYLKKDIDGLISKRDLLTEEVKTLQEAREKALLPLDKEREEIDKRQVNLTALERSLSEAFIKSEANKRDLLEKSIEADKNLTQSRLTLEESKRLRAEATICKDSTERILIETTKQVNRNTKDTEKRALEVFQRESAVGAREYNSEIRAKNQDKRERELNERERAINDKYSTLERTLKRLK